MVTTALLALLGCAPAAFAFSAPQIYWANGLSKAIGVAKLDGTAVNQRFITTAASPTGVAVDGNRIYWSNLIRTSGLGTLGVANLDGSGVNQSFINSSAAGQPFGVAVNSQHIFWTGSTSTITAANLDGTNPNQLIFGGKLIEDVAVDGRHIYWADNVSNAIGIANLDGTGVNQNFITGASNPAGVAVDSQRIYWANAGSNTIGIANLDGTGGDENFIPTGSNPSGIAVSVPVAAVSPASPPAFPSTAIGSLSPPLTLNVRNTGQRQLLITGLSFAGADQDFIIGSNTCLGPIAQGQSCQLTVNFVPFGAGRRSATLEITSNDYADSPLQVPLSGTGRSTLGSGTPLARRDVVMCTSVRKKVRRHLRARTTCVLRGSSSLIPLKPLAAIGRRSPRAA